MTFPAVILAIPCLGLLVLLWTIWRCVIHRPRPSSVPLEQSCGVAVIFMLMAASSALTFRDCVAFISSVRGGPLASFEWIPAGVMVFSVLIACGFFGVTGFLWFQRRQVRQQSAGSSATLAGRDWPCMDGARGARGNLPIGEAFGCSHVIRP
jgi:hypothetical protein